MKDTTYYDEGTLVKAHSALMASDGLSSQHADDIIQALLNGGILLRERSTEPEVGITYLLDLNGLDDYRATFTVPPDGSAERATLTIPHTQWVSLGRPGRVDVAVEVDQ